MKDRTKCHKNIKFKNKAFRISLYSRIEDDLNFSYLVNFIVLAIDTTRCAYTMGIVQKYFLFSGFYANKVYCCFAKSIAPGI